MNKKYPNPIGTMQIYPAYDQHSSVQILGCWKAILNLIWMLLKALVRGRSEATVWASDGEGYSIQILKVSDETVEVNGFPKNPIWDNVNHHYQDDYISDCGFDPQWLFVSQKEFERIRNNELR